MWRSLSVAVVTVVAAADERVDETWVARTPLTNK
jgi:hypothetical protein